MYHLSDICLKYVNMYTGMFIVFDLVVYRCLNIYWCWYALCVSGMAVCLNSSWIRSGTNLSEYIKKLTHRKKK